MESNTEFENIKSRLEHFGFTVGQTEEKGRYVTSKKDFKQGDLVFRV